MRRFFRPAATLALVVILAAAGYTGFWFYAAGSVRNGLAEWTAARRADGFQVDYVAPQISGFPFGIRVQVDRPVITAPAQRWRWSGDGIEAEAHPWAFRRIILRPIGQQVLSFPSTPGDEKIAASAQAAQATAILDDRGRLHHVDALVEGLTLTAPDAPGPVTAQTTRLALSLPPAIQPPATTTDGNRSPSLPPSAFLTLRLEDINLPKAIAGPLGPQLRWLTIDGEITGRLPAAPSTAALQAWRDEGGTIELKTLDFSWGPLQLAADATMALDGNMQPEGAGTAKIKGYAETIDSLVAQGLMKPENGMIAKAGLGLLAKAPPDGGAKELTVPLTLERQVLYAGPVMVLSLPTIKWPE